MKVILLIITVMTLVIGASINSMALTLAEQIYAAMFYIMALLSFCTFALLFKGRVNWKCNWLLEECGLEAELDEDFRTEYTFHTLDNTEKTSVFFAGRFDRDAAVKIQQEEVIGDWLLSYGEAMNKLNWEQDKVILKACEEYLNSKQK